MGLRYLFRLFTFLPLVLASSIQSQDCSLQIEGILIDDHDKTPLSYANVLILETGKGEATSENGSFLIEGLCAGVYTIRYSHIGCTPKTITVELKESIFLNLQLEHHTELLQAIIVESRSFGEAVSQSKGKLDAEQIARFNGKSLGQALESINGVQSLQTGPTVFKPVIRGLHSNRVILFNNGLRQTGQEWGSDHAPEVDINMIDQVTVLKGAGTMQYGVDAIGGIIIVDRGRLPYQKPGSGKFQISTMSNGRLLSGGIDLDFPIGTEREWAGGFQASWKRGGDFKAPDYHLKNTGLKELNASAAFGFERNASGIELYVSTFNTTMGVLRSAHIGNLTDFENAISQNVPLVLGNFSYQINAPKQEVTHHLAKVEAKKWIHSGMLKAIYGVQYNGRKEFDIRRGDRNEIPALSLALWSQQMDVSFHHHSENDRMHGTIGIAWNYQDNSNDPETGIRPLVPDFTKFSPGIYVTERYEGEKFVAETGLRFDHQKLRVFRFNEMNVLEKPEFIFSQFAGTVGASFRPANTVSYSFNLSTAYRAPGVHELFSEGLHHGAASIEEGNAELSPERSLEIQGAIGWNISSSLEFVSEVYWKRINDFIYLSPLPEPRLTIRGAFPVFKYSQTNARLLGSDFSLKWQISNGLKSTTKGSFVRANNLVDGSPIIFMPADQLSQHFFYQSKKSEKGLAWNASCSIDLVSRQNRFPVGLDLIPPPDGYQLVQGGFGLEFLHGENKVEVSFRVTNIFNTRYRSYLNRLRYFADETGRNFEIHIQYYLSN